MSPWVGFYNDIWRLRVRGGVHYRINPQFTRLYYHVQWICYHLDPRYSGEVKSYIREGQAKAPSNPVFDYLQASVMQREDDLTGAVRCIDKGNGKGIMRLYATYREPADQWQWPEISIICHTGKMLAKDESVPNEVLISVLKMGDKILNCEPSDSTKMLQAIDLMQSACRVLLKKAREDRDVRLEKVCTELSDRLHSLTIAINRTYAHRSPSSGDSQAWVVGRTAGNSNRRLRNDAMLLFRERQAEWADKLRREHPFSNLIGELK